MSLLSFCQFLKDVASRSVEIHQATLCQPLPAHQLQRMGRQHLDLAEAPEFQSPGREYGTKTDGETATRWASPLESSRVFDNMQLSQCFFTQESELQGQLLPWIIGKTGLTEEQENVWKIITVGERRGEDRTEQDGTGQDIKMGLLHIKTEPLHRNHHPEMRYYRPWSTQRISAISLIIFLSPGYCRSISWCGSVQKLVDCCWLLTPGVKCDGVGLNPS